MGLHIDSETKLLIKFLMILTWKTRPFPESPVSLGEQGALLLLITPSHSLQRSVPRGIAAALCMCKLTSKLGKEALCYPVQESKFSELLRPVLPDTSSVVTCRAHTGSMNAVTAKESSATELG